MVEHFKCIDIGCFLVSLIQNIRTIISQTQNTIKIQMKDIILSIKHKYAKEIIDGKKRYEFRSWIWKNEVRYVYLYSSGEIRKIIARFKVKQIINDIPSNIWIKCKRYSGVTEEDFFSYVTMFNHNIMYAIEISELEILKPVNYVSLKKIGIINTPQKYKYLDDNISKILEKIFNEQYRNMG